MGEVDKCGAAAGRVRLKLANQNRACRHDGGLYALQGGVVRATVVHAVVDRAGDISERVQRVHGELLVADGRVRPGGRAA